MRILQYYNQLTIFTTSRISDPPLKNDVRGMPPHYPYLYTCCRRAWLSSVMGTNSFKHYIVTVTSLLTIVTNGYLQLAECNEEMGATLLLKSK
jgi:hypothetical protein